jgi:glycosyltransferase involved in cell wall biosynthesis
LKNVIIFQPALPTYRLDLFERISQRLGDTFLVCYSQADMGALSDRSSEPSWAKRLPPIRQILPGLEWQSKVLTTPIRRGDLIVVSGAPRNVSNMLMLAWARIKGARTIWWGHYWSSTSRTHRFLLRLLLMRLADAVLFYTDREVDEYRSGRGRRDPRIVTALNNGVDVDTITTVRKPYDARKREKAILFIGRLTEKAELTLLLEALADQRLRDVTLQVVGDGPQKQRLQTLAQELRVDDRIFWHGGTTNETLIARVANRCRLFVYPGPVGLSLLHAMAYGLPAVVHDERFRQGPEIAAFLAAEVGLSFRRGDVESLADVISQSLDSPKKLNRWSAKSIRQCDDVYNTKSMAARFVELLAKLSTK